MALAFFNQIIRITRIIKLLLFISIRFWRIISTTKCSMQSTKHPFIFFAFILFVILLFIIPFIIIMTFIVLLFVILLFLLWFILLICIRIRCMSIALRPC